MTISPILKNPLSGLVATKQPLTRDAQELLNDLDAGYKKIQQMERDFISLRLQTAEQRLALTGRLAASGLASSKSAALGDLRAYGRELQSLGRQIGVAYDLDDGLAVLSARQVGTELQTANKSQSLLQNSAQGKPTSEKAKAVLARFTALVGQYNALASIVT